MGDELQVLYGLLAPPADVQNFTVNIIDNVALLSWDPVSEANFSHYQVATH